MKVHSSVLTFTARIGPPKLHLEAEDKAIVINISAPGAKDSVMWQLENLSFTYSVVIWSNMSGAQVSAALAYVQWKLTHSPWCLACALLKNRLLFFHYRHGMKLIIPHFPELKFTSSCQRPCTV